MQDLVPFNTTNEMVPVVEKWQALFPSPDRIKMDVTPTDGILYLINVVHKMESLQYTRIVEYPYLFRKNAQGMVVRMVICMGFYFYAIDVPIEHLSSAVAIDNSTDFTSKFPRSLNEYPRHSFPEVVADRIVESGEEASKLYKNSLIYVRFGVNYDGVFPTDMEMFPPWMVFFKYTKAFLDSVVFLGKTHIAADFAGDLITTLTTWVKTLQPPTTNPGWAEMGVLKSPRLVKVADDCVPTATSWFPETDYLKPVPSAGTRCVNGKSVTFACSERLTHYALQNDDNISGPFAKPGYYPKVSLPDEYYSYGQCENFTPFSDITKKFLKDAKNFQIGYIYASSVPNIALEQMTFYDFINDKPAAPPTDNYGVKDVHDWQVKVNVQGKHYFKNYVLQPGTAGQSGFDGARREIMLPWYNCNTLNDAFSYALRDDVNSQQWNDIATSVHVSGEIPRFGGAMLWLGVDHKKLKLAAKAPETVPANFTHVYLNAIYDISFSETHCFMSVVTGHAVACISIKLSAIARDKFTLVNQVIDQTTYQVPDCKDGIPLLKRSEYDGQFKNFPTTWLMVYHVFTMSGDYYASRKDNNGFPQWMTILKNVHTIDWDAEGYSEDVITGTDISQLLKDAHDSFITKKVPGKYHARTVYQHSKTFPTFVTVPSQKKIKLA